MMGMIVGKWLLWRLNMYSKASMTQIPITGLLRLIQTGF